MPEIISGSWGLVPVLNFRVMLPYLYFEHVIFFIFFSKVAAVSACRRPSIIGCNWEEDVVREADKAVVRGLLPSF